MNSIRKLLLNLCQISVFWTRMLLKPVRHLGTVLCFHFSGETLTWSLRQKGYFCVWHRLMFRMKAPFYLKKKHALYAYGRRNDFDIDLAWVGLGGGIPLLHFKKIFAQSSTKCYHCHSYLNSDCIKRRLHCCGVCVLI